MQEVSIIVQQIIKLFLIGLVGYIISKTKYLPKQTVDILAKFVIKVCVPVLIFTSMISKEFSAEVLLNGLKVYLYGLIFICIGLLMGTVGSKLLQLKGDKSSIFILQSTFGNIMFVGLPLINLIFGTEGLIYAVFFVFANDTIVFTFGVYILKREKSSIKQNIKSIINPNLITYFIASFLLLINFVDLVNSNPITSKGYKIFMDSFYPLGQSTLYVSMIFIGMALSKVKMDNVKDKIKTNLVISIIKLIFLPLGAMLIIFLFGNNLSTAVAGTLIIQLSSPSGTIVSSLAASHGRDLTFATESLFYTSLLCVFTIPTIVFFFNLIFV